MKVKLRVWCKLWAQRDHLQLQEKLKAWFTTTGYQEFHTPLNLHRHPRQGFWPQWLKYGRRCSALLRLETRWRWRWDKAGSCRRCAGRKLETTEADSQGRNEEETNIKTEWGFQFGPCSRKPPALSIDVPPLLTLLSCGLYLPFSVASRGFLCHHHVSCHRCYRSTVERCNCCKGPGAVSLTASLALLLLCDLPVVMLPPSWINRQFPLYI